MLKNISDKMKNLSGIEKSKLLYIFNKSYLYNENINTKHTGFINIYHNENYNDYIDGIIKFCLETDICDKLKLSIRDFMYMDFYLYNKIKHAYLEHKPKESRILDDLLHK